MQTNNKLRESLTKVKEWMERRIATRGFEASATFPTMLEDVVLPALSAPARNCDRFPSLWDAVVSFGIEDQGWLDWPDEDVKPGDANGLINRLTADQVHELVDWLYAEAEGVNDEQ